MATAEDLARSFLDAARRRLADALVTIEHCLDQLSEDDLTWRPYEGHNSVSTIILHLCGNLRQWIVSGAGGTDVRDRPAEFTDRARRSRRELRSALREAVRESDAVLARLGPGDLLAGRRIQGFDVTLLPALLDTVAHFTGHMQEITWITRLRVGEAYRFRWAPATKEQGA